MKKRYIAVLSVITLVVAAYSCKKSTSTQPLKGATLQLPATTAVYYDGGSFASSVDSLNKVATLGRVLFYDQHLSLNNAVSCGSCHKQSIGFSDNVAFSTGYEGKLTKRNSRPINDLAGSGSLFWDGRENSVNNLSLRPLTNHVEMGIEDANTLPQKLGNLGYYNTLFLEAFGNNMVTMDRISSAIGTFINAIKTGNSRLDQFNRGNTSALTAQEIQGKMLFDTKYNCGQCHNGGQGGVFLGGGSYGGNGFSFLDIGLNNSYTDMGRGTLTGLSSDNGTFRVPNLHNVALTAPYMHDGRYKTLDEVLEHYSHNIQDSPNLDTLLKDNKGHARQMNITDAEKKAIIAFLNKLTDYQMISDPKFSNPFKVNN